MYHDTLHRRRQSVIFHVAHAGRLLSATLAFWNIDNVVERNEFNRGWVSKGLQKYLQRFRWSSQNSHGETDSLANMVFNEGSSDCLRTI